MIHELYKRPIWIRDNVLSEEQLAHLEQICFEHADQLETYSDRYNPQIYRFGRDINLNINEDPKFNWICDIVLDELKTYCTELGHSEDVIDNLYIYNSWIGMYKEGDYISQHTHRDMYWSAAFYIRNNTPTKLKFIHDMYITQPYPKDFKNEWLKNYTEYECTKNRCIIFNSYDCHGVEGLVRPEGIPEDEILKIMISFNFSSRR